MTLLRSLLFNVWFVGVTIVVGIACLPVRWFAPQRTLPMARFWAGLVIAGAKSICRIRVDITGLERLPPGPLLLASQHQSAFDTLIWAVMLPRVSYIYKAELERIPLFGPMLPATGQIPLDRAGSLTTVRRLLRATEQAKRSGRQIVIFPEGTRVPAGETAPIRPGFAIIAARTALPIYPVATDSGRCWGRRAFTKRAGTIHIHVGEPIPPDLPAPDLIATLRERWQIATPPVNPVDKLVDAAVPVRSRPPPNPSAPEAFAASVARHGAPSSTSASLPSIGK